MPDLCSLSVAELKTWLASQNEKEFHAKQVMQWIYEKGVVSWEEMTNLGKSLKQKLAEHLTFPILKLEQMCDSQDGQTFKFLWRLHDGALVESVLICSDERRTVCVSSQVGCPARCAFCASGKEGLMRSLSTAEILEQVLHIDLYLRKKNERVSHVVYMGMGEPLDNYDPVVKSIRLLNDPELLHISQRRITVSTVGIVEGIKKLTTEDLKVNLVLSLHAPNQHIRKKIIPYARKYPLEDILKAMDDYSTQTKRDITFEYTLLDGINDEPEHALELAQLVKGKQCTVNLIPYNPVLGLKLKRPSSLKIKEFRKVLDNARIVNTCRYTKGDDIAAACGQLALVTKTNEETQMKMLPSPLPMAS